MEQSIKNRLVGVIVIFALAVIFLPMILDGAGVRKQSIEVVIPPQPVVSSNPEFEPRMIELQASTDALPELEARFVDEKTPEQKPVKEAEQTEPAPAVAKSTTTAKVEQPAVEPKRVGGDSWVLQVGSYQDRQKALVQRDKLRKSNIAAVFIEQFEIDNKAIYRVRLGPFINREQTRVAQNKIKAKHDIDGIIMKYER